MIIVILCFVAFVTVYTSLMIRWKWTPVEAMLATCIGAFVALSIATAMHNLQSDDVPTEFVQIGQSF